MSIGITKQVLKNKMNSAIESMNTYIRWYLTTNEEVDNYIRELEFNTSSPDEFDIDEEWDNFCEEFFNNWCSGGKSFYNYNEDFLDFDAKEMIWLIKMVNTYWIETTGDPFELNERLDDEDVYNNIAYAWIRERSDDIKKDILKKIQARYDEWMEEC